MALFEQLLINGIITGGVYVLVAVGLTIVFGVLGIVNFAHGEFYMLGGYFTLIIGAALGLSFFPALALAMAGGALIGVVCEYLIFRPSKVQLSYDTIISSFALSVILQNLALLLFGPQPQLIRTPLNGVIVRAFDAYVSLQRILIPVTAAVIVGLLYLFLNYTWTGRALRAVAQQRTVASIVGIDVTRVGLIAFALSGALAAGAGGLMGTIFLMQPTMGAILALKAFTVVILGGMGSVYGAVAAGMMLGITESLAAGFLGNQLKDIVAFALVVAVLLIKPSGLFGSSAARA